MGIPDENELLTICVKIDVIEAAASKRLRHRVDETERCAVAFKTRGRDHQLAQYMLNSVEVSLPCTAALLGLPSLPGETYAACQRSHDQAQNCYDDQKLQQSEAAITSFLQSL